MKTTDDLPKSYNITINDKNTATMDIVWIEDNEGNITNQPVGAAYCNDLSQLLNFAEEVSKDEMLIDLIKETIKKGFVLTNKV